MAAHYRTVGIIFKKKERGEADLVFTAYTRDFGKLKVVGRAIRKIRSKLRGGAGLFYLSEIDFIQGKAYKTLTDTILVKNFKNIRKDLKRLEIACRAAEVLDRLIKEEEPDPEIWKLVIWVFGAFDTLEIAGEKLKAAYFYFLWNLFSLLGYEPELYYCPLCQKKISDEKEKFYFSPKDGGIICSSCQKTKEMEEIGPDFIKILRLFLKKNWQVLSRLKIKARHLRELETVSEKYLAWVLGENE
jgi:DNA repair protein RecO (recombination protein O)